VFSVYEGVATQITENNYNWQWKLNGIYLTACGAMSIAGFLALKPLETKIGSRQVMITAMTLAALSYVPLCDRIFPNNFVPLWAYIMSSLMLSFGYPTAQAMSLVLFTKIVPASKQGIMMGLLTSTGSVARMCVIFNSLFRVCCQRKFTHSVCRLGPAWGTYSFNIVNNQT
jgi:MFS-type transporter involved in bile tolerance (Atg22 family)